MYALRKGGLTCLEVVEYSLEVVGTLAMSTALIKGMSEAMDSLILLMVRPEQLTKTDNLLCLWSNH